LETEVSKTLSTAELVDASGVTRQYIARLERAGVIKKVARGEYPASSVAEIAAFRAGEPLPGEESPASLTQERTLLVRAQREKAELDLAERRGELQSRAETAADLVTLSNAIRNRCWRSLTASQAGSACSGTLLRPWPKKFETP